MTVPTGVTEGRGVVNTVNCIFKPQRDAHAMFYEEPSYSDRPCHWVLRKTDFDGGYQFFSVPTGPRFTDSEYDKITIDSVYYRSDTSIFFYRVPNLQILTDNKGTNSVGYGVSQYTDGYAPVPTTGRIIRVGATRTYTTIASAYAASKHGDDIVIDSGTYAIDNNFVITKCVRFWGATENPGDVILKRTANFGSGERVLKFYPYYMGNVPDGYFGCGIFHLTLDTTENPYPYGAMLSIYSTYGTDVNQWAPIQPEVSNAIMFSCNT